MKAASIVFCRVALATSILTLIAATSLVACGNSALTSSGTENASPDTEPAAPIKTSPHAKTVVMVIMENRDYELIIGNSQAPYINNTLVPEAALMTDSHAVGHPSQPNYLALFSGSMQGIVDDSCPHTFGAVNVGEELIGANKTFDGYSESMPSDGYTGCSSGEYARKHNSLVNFTNVPATSNLIYSGFPMPPPTLSIIVPNLCNDMHDCSTMTGDTWLSKNLPPILKYNQSHNGLLILTWDEAYPDAKGTNQIATLLIGPMVTPGSYSQVIDHYSVLRTIEIIVGVACTANACQAVKLKQMWH